MPDPPAERVIYLTELTEPRVRILRPDTRDFLTLEWSADAFPLRLGLGQPRRHPLPLVRQAEAR